MAHDILNILSEIFSRFGPSRPPGSPANSISPVAPTTGSQGSNSPPDGIESPHALPPLLSDAALEAKYPGNETFQGVLREDGDSLPFNMRGNKPPSPISSKDARYPLEDEWIYNDGKNSPPAQIHGFNTQGPSVQFGDAPVKENVERSQPPYEPEDKMSEALRKLYSSRDKDKNPN